MLIPFLLSASEKDSDRNTVLPGHLPKMTGELDAFLQERCRKAEVVLS